MLICQTSDKKDWDWKKSINDDIVCNKYNGQQIKIIKKNTTCSASFPPHEMLTEQFAQQQSIVFVQNKPFNIQLCKE